MFRSKKKRGAVVSLGQGSHSLGQGPVLLCGPSMFPLLCKGAGSLAWHRSPSPAPVGLAEQCAGSAALDVGTEPWETSQVEGYELLA